MLRVGSHSLARHGVKQTVLRLAAATHLQRALSTSAANGGGTSTLHTPGEKGGLHTTHEQHGMLRTDVKKLGRMLGQAISVHSGDEIFQKVERLRLLAKQWRDGDASALQSLNKEVATFTGDEHYHVARAFANFLALANTAETFNKVRRLRTELTSTKETLPLPLREDTCLGNIQRLLNEAKIPPDEIYQAIISQKIELVLTAHPTEVNRRTYLNKHKKVAMDMEKLHFQGKLTPYEKSEVEKSLKREITSIWNSEMIRRTKPTPVDEARSGLAVVEQVLWDAVPSFLRKLDATMEMTLGKRLPITAAPVCFASWMGGDRDGNPFVTPQITRTVALRARWQAMRLLLRDIRELKMVLSSTKCSEELRMLVGKDAREPYREVVKLIEEDVEATIEVINDLFAPDGTLMATEMPHLPITSTPQVLDKLLLLHRSLCETQQALLADGLLVDTIRRLKCFGVSLLPLDIRQESTVHTETLDAITRYLGLGSYAQWDEDTRMSWLNTELTAKRPLLPKEQPLARNKDFNFSPAVVDCLETFRMIVEMGEESLGAYVISMSKAPSDVLAVKLLMKEFGLKRNMRVAPLFETLDDLNQSADTMETLFSHPWYRGHIQGKQEIMIGYSDSSKDAGRLAALWSQYEAQERLAGLGKKHGVELTFFHGKGGTVSRGGNPCMYKALVGMPPDTLKGRFRVTEQGEMITQNFGHRAVAEATLDLYNAGVLAEFFQPPVEPSPAWRDVMKQLADIGCQHYRATVRGDPRFVPYFRAATPEQELGSANIGSRPQKRRPGGVETLRAIPWVFSWTQTRLHLSAWLGVGEALEAIMASPEHAPTLVEMYKHWPFLYTNMDLVDMILAKADKDIAQNYDKLLVSDPEQLKLGAELRVKLEETCTAVLKLSGHQKLQQTNLVLQWAIVLRNAYVDPLNILQAHVLKRLRTEAYSSEEEKLRLQDALVVTINGISAGMRNSG
jgi:phosphoenolpyruvate carboxylase|eukprot:evm.model.NODE_2531_length_39259_cov_31.881454.7